MQSGGLRLNEFNSTINLAIAPPKGLAVWAGCPDKLTTWPPLCHGARPAEGWQPVVDWRPHVRAATSGTRGLEGRWPGSGVQILTRGGWRLQAYVADNDWTWPDSRAGATMAPAWAGG